MRQRVLVAAVLIMFGMAAPASAQSLYVAGAGFADIKSFDSTELAGQDFSLSGTGAGAGIRLGGFITPMWSLEFAVDAGSRTESDSLDITRYSPIAGLSTFPTLEFSQSTQFTAYSTTIGFHPPQRGRIQFGFRAGFSIIHGSYKSTYPAIGLPQPLFTPGRGLSFDLSGFPIQLPPPNFTRTTIERGDNSGALVLGADMAFALTPRLSLIPEVRVSTFQNVLMIRPGGGLRWKF